MAELANLRKGKLAEKDHGHPTHYNHEVYSAVLYYST